MISLWKNEDHHKKGFLIRSKLGSIQNQKEAKLHNTQSVFFNQNSTSLIHYFRPLYIGNRLECWKAYNYIMINEITLMWLIIARKCYKIIGFDLRWLNQFLKLNTHGCYFCFRLCSSTTQINCVSPLLLQLLHLITSSTLIPFLHHDIPRFCSWVQQTKCREYSKLSNALKFTSIGHS